MSVGSATFSTVLPMMTMSRLRHSTPRVHHRRSSVTGAVWSIAIGTSSIGRIVPCYPQVVASANENLGGAVRARWPGVAGDARDDVGTGGFDACPIVEGSRAGRSAGGPRSRRAGACGGVPDGGAAAGQDRRRLG